MIWKHISAKLMIAVTCVLGPGSSGGREQPERPTYVLDLVAAPRPVEDPTRDVPVDERLSVGFGGGGEVTHEPRPVLPLQVELLATDRLDYRVADRLEFTLLVRNIGKTTFSFPASIEGQRFRRGMAGARLALVALLFEDAVLSKQLVAIQALYGATEIAGSLIPLAPGESVQIRAEGEWFLHSPMPKVPMDAWTRQINVHGSLQVHYLDKPYPTATSTNSIALRLAR